MAIPWKPLDEASTMYDSLNSDPSMPHGWWSCPAYAIQQEIWYPYPRWTFWRVHGFAVNKVPIQNWLKCSTTVWRLGSIWQIRWNRSEISWAQETKQDAETENSDCWWNNHRLDLVQQLQTIAVWSWNNTLSLTLVSFPLPWWLGLSLVWWAFRQIASCAPSLSVFVDVVPLVFRWWL